MWWIVTQALKAYLSNLHQIKLAKDAQRQSELARRLDTSENRCWEINADDSEWD
jgi:hypothetical protein